MIKVNPQAEEANEIIRNCNPSVHDLLSRKGIGIYYPRKGILAQGASAKGKEINATVGTAYEDDGAPMVLPSMSGLLDINAANVFPYAPSEGNATLRTKWQELIKSKNPSLGKQEISLPVATCGVTNGLSIIGYMFVDEGDEIIVSDLYWENYDLVYTNACGAELKCFNFFKDGEVSVEEAFYYARYKLSTDKNLKEFDSMEPQITDRFPHMGLFFSRKGLILGEN